MKERTDKNINPNEEEKTNSETNENIEKEVLKTTNKKKIIFNFVLILAIFVGLTIYMIKVDGIDNIIKILIYAVVSILFLEAPLPTLKIVHLSHFLKAAAM